MKHRLWRFVVLLAFAIAACTYTPPEAATEVPMITDTDLDAAGSLPTASEAQRSALDLELPTLEAIDIVPSRDTLTPGIVLEGARLPSGDGTPGHLIFVQDRQAGSTKYAMRLGTVGQPQTPAQLIYQGKREIESAAVSTDSALVIFTMRSAAGDLDPYLLDIVVVFANDLLSPGQRAAFQDAADRWAEVITADLAAAQPGDVPADFSCAGEPAFNGFVDDLVISAFGAVIDGAGGVLASAGPCAFRAAGSNGALAPLPVYGILRFDVADLDNLETGGGLFPTILHEMGHVLGVGTLWDDNDLIDFVGDAPSCRDATFTTPPTFAGAVGNAQYAILGGSGGAPIEDEFGPGTKCGHWDEAVFGTEPMTGFLDISASEPLSILTVGSLADLGYAVDLAAADPYTIPTTATLRDPSAAYGFDVVLDNVGKNKR